MTQRRSRRRWLKRAPVVATVMTLGLLLAATTLSWGHSAGSTGGHVYRDGEQLMLNGVPYRFVGVNNYDLTGCHTGDPAPAAEAEKFFAQLPPNSMVRVWAFEEWGLDAVERTVRLAEKHSQKLILAFADGAGFCNAPDFDLAWYEGGYRGSYFTWVEEVTTAFKSSPAVGIWEIMNEPGSTAAGLDAEVVKRFYDATAAHIKKFDPAHLVSTGALAPWQYFQRGATGYAHAHSGPDIDVVSVHEFDFPYSDGQTIVSPHFTTALQAARSIGKPVYVGETGVSLAHGCMTADERAAVVREKFTEYLEAGAAGALYWVVLGPPNNPGSVCDSDDGNRDPMVGGAVMPMLADYWQRAE